MGSVGRGEGMKQSDVAKDHECVTADTTTSAAAPVHGGQLKTSGDVTQPDDSGSKDSENEPSSSEASSSSESESESDSDSGSDDEPDIELSESELVYRGPPDDRKALMAHRKRIRERQEELQRAHDAWVQREKRREKANLAIEQAEEMEEARLTQKRDAEMLEVNKAREKLTREYTQKRLQLMNAAHAGGGALGMDRYFNVYHYLPEVDPARLYVEPNYQVDGNRRTLHKNSDKEWGYYCFLEEYDQLCNYLNSYGRREYALLTQLGQPRITNNMIKHMRCRAREEQEAEAQEKKRLREEKRRLREEKRLKEEAERQAARIAAGMPVPAAQETRIQKFHLICLSRLPTSSARRRISTGGKWMRSPTLTNSRASTRMAT